MPESDCPGSFQLPLAWAYNLTGDFCHFFCLDKRHFITVFAGVQHCRLLPEHRGEVSRSDGEGLRGPCENPSQALPRQLSPALLRGASQAGSSQTLLLTAYPPVTVAGSGDSPL